MALGFNADEIFEMAEQIERNGGVFYRKAAEHVTGKERDFLLELAAMEDAHEVTFQGMRQELSAKQKETVTFDPYGEAPQYLKALADSRVFFEKELDPRTMSDILKSAIIAEKESIVFYLGMKEMVAEHQGKARIDDIIREEMDHIKLLSNRLIETK